MKKFFLVFFLLLGSAFATSDADPVDLWNDFANSVQRWTVEVNRTQGKTVSVEEYHQWSEVRRKWHKLEPYFNRYYHQ